MSDTDLEQRLAAEFGPVTDANRLDVFAEAVSQGVAVGKAARLAGKGYADGTTLLNRIKRRLGEP